MTEQDKHTYLQWIDNALKNAHSSYTKNDLYEKKIRFLENEINERIELEKEMRKVAYDLAESKQQLLAKIFKYESALDKLTDAEGYFGEIAREAIRD